MYQKPSINYAYFVEDVSRKFTLRKNTCSNKALGVKDLQPVKYMGGAVRTNKRFDLTGLTPVKLNYMFLRFNPRASQPSGEELAYRNAFGQASKLASRWKNDPTQITAINNAWTDPTNGYAKGITKRGYTLAGWLFAVAYAVISDGGTTESQFPQYTPAGA